MMGSKELQLSFFPPSEHTCIKDDGGTPGRKCLACEAERAENERFSKWADSKVEQPITSSVKLSVMHSSKRCDWGTPESLFKPLHAEFDFGIDLAAENHNRKCAKYLGPDHLFTEYRDALKVDWFATTPRVSDSTNTRKLAAFLNPPYSVKLKMPITPWLAKAVEESEKGLTVVGIIPANVQTKWWNDYVRKAFEVRFLTHRVSFEPPPGVGSASNAGHNVAVVIWKPLKQLGYVNFTEPSYRYVEYREEKKV